MSIKIKLKVGEYELDKSKFFGETLMPEIWLKQDIFEETEVFFCHINLEEASQFDSQNLLPKTGHLFFFIDFEKTPVKAVVRYYGGELDATANFNECIDCDYEVEEGYQIEFSKGEGETTSLFAPYKKLKDSEVCLLSFYPDEFVELDFLKGDAKAIHFIIEKTSLMKKDFASVLLIAE